MKPFDRVVLTTDRFSDLGAPRGTEAFIVDEYETGDFELEVVGEGGVTLALFSCQPADIELAE